MGFSFSFGCCSCNRKTDLFQSTMMPTGETNYKNADSQDINKENNIKNNKSINKKLNSNSKNQFKE